ncbi:MAG: efflux transporter periplasmic adaptor subunit, partial [Shewanella sp.]
MKKTIIAITLLGLIATAVSFSDLLHAAKPDNAPPKSRTVPVVTGLVVEHPL